FDDDDDEEEEEEPLRLDLLRPTPGAGGEADRKELLRVAELRRLVAKRAGERDARETKRRKTARARRTEGPRSELRAEAPDDSREERPEAPTPAGTRRSRSTAVASDGAEVGRRGKEGEAGGRDEDDEEEECAYDDDDNEECWDITRSNFAERTSRSLSTTLPPSNVGKNRSRSVKSAVNPGGEGSNGTKGSSAENSTNLHAEEVLREGGTEDEAEDEWEDEDSPSAEEECAYDDDDEECWDITRSSFAGRESPSLSTTLPPKSRPPRPARTVGRQRRDDEPFYDITQSLFPEVRTGQTLSSLSFGRRPRSAFREGERSEMNDRPPPPRARSEARAKALTDDTAGSNGPAARTAAEEADVGEGGGGDAEERARWIAEQNEAARERLAKRLEEERARGLPDAETARRQAAAFDSDAKEDEEVELVGEAWLEEQNRLVQGRLERRREEERGIALADEGDSEAEGDGRPGISSEANGREVRADAGKGAAKTDSMTAMPSMASPIPKREVATATSRRAAALYRKFARGRRSSFDGGDRSEMNDRPPPPASSTGPRWSRKRDLNPSASGDGGVLDLPSRFPRDRPSVSVNTSTVKDRVTTSGSYREESRAGLTGDADDSYLDIGNSFPRQRPSAMVNTGTAKDRVTTSGSYHEESRAGSRGDTGDSYLDAGYSFSQQRPSSLVNTGTTKDRVTTSGSYHDERRAGSRAAVSDSYLDVGNSFLKDRPSSLVNTGTMRRETTSRSWVGRFSQDQVSLRGHPPAKTIGGGSIESPKGQDNFLDQHTFSQDLAPRSTATGAASTNAVWRRSSGTGKDEEHLDTPRAFARNIDMAPASGARVDATNKRRSRTDTRNNRGTEEMGDDFLDTNSFSPDLRSTASSEKRGLAGTGQEYLDRPRPFRRGVDMTSSALSGARHKRSSEMTPEERRAETGYLDTAPMSDINEMARTKVSRRVSKPTTFEDDDAFDITRTPFSTLERTSSAVKDANSAFKASSKRNLEVAQDAEATPADETFHYEEVMRWLLSHLPLLHEDDAIAYFECLLEDGFDSLENLGELREEDLGFLKEGHRRALLRSLLAAEAEGSTADADTSASRDNDGTTAQDVRSPAGTDEADILDELFKDVTRSMFVDKSATAGKKQVTPADADPEVFDITRSAFENRPTLAAAPLPLETPTTKEEKMEALLAEQSRVRERLALRQVEEKSNGEPFKDITRSEFVERHSLSKAAPDSSVTRDSFPDRPSLVTHLSTPLDEGGNGSTPSTRSDQPMANYASVGGALHVGAGPRAELYQWYIKKGGLTTEEGQMIKDYFTTWDDKEKPHKTKFTCIFTCPLTGEHFACGRWNAGGKVIEVPISSDGVFWYSNKKRAMNAAAARALDCLSFREHGGTGAALPQRCHDAPYSSSAEAPAFAIPERITLPTKLIQSPDMELDS
ncbi:hypothetical protein ACHAWF_012772, partial [Thalassiosira exigua]